MNRRFLTLTLPIALAAAGALAHPVAARQGGYGFGGYYGGYYDPSDPERSYPDPAGAPRSPEEGRLSLRVTPKQASVYIDGRYTGVVDAFDDASRPVRIDAGPHRIEIKQRGFRTLMLDVNIEPNRTTIRRAGLKKTR